MIFNTTHVFQLIRYQICDENLGLNELKPHNENLEIVK